ncbi:hypothetical protein EMCRGX_G025062 [Ephydatia muelleri]
MDPCVVEHAGADPEPAPMDSALPCIQATHNVTELGATSMQAATTEPLCAGSTCEAKKEPASSSHLLQGEHHPPEDSTSLRGTGEHHPPEDSTSLRGTGNTILQDCPGGTPSPETGLYRLAWRLVHVTESPIPGPVELPSLLPSESADLLGVSHKVSVASHEDLNGLTHKVITRSPSLHANEEFIDDLEDEMDTMTANEASRPGEEGCKLAPGNGHSLSDPSPDRSDTTSPYPNDDESFASFVAREANSSIAPLIDEDQSSLSRSPSPTASQPDDDGDGMEPGLIFTTYVTQFGPTAYSPTHPTVIPDNAPLAPLDVTLHNFPKRSKYAHRAALSAMHPYHRTRGGGVSAVKTLDLLKTVLQPSLNLKIKTVCDDYLKILSSAAMNMRENTGDVVPEPTLKVLVSKMLEESLHGYQNNKWEFPYNKLPRNDKIMAAKASPMATKKMKGMDPKVATAKRNRKQPSDRDKSSGWKWGMDKRRVDPEKWEPEKLSNDTHFVLGVNVNKALGHSANRGKVYYLHPELFKYACDGDDKTWLYENKHLPVHGGKAFLMIFAEIEMLVDMDEVYRDNPEVVTAVKQLQHFTVPQFMLDKMKVFMVSVQGYFAQESVVLPMGMELPPPPPPGMVLATDEEEVATEEKSQ